MKLTKPYIGFFEHFAVSKVLLSGNLTQGSIASTFEKQIANFTGARNVFVTSSATTGLHLALDALGITPGSEVIIPDFSFPATANAIIKVGAIPVCIDIDSESYCINVDYLKENIKPGKTKAIMPVHAFGLCADMDRIIEIAKEYNLIVIEDAACAIGSKINSTHAGLFGDCGVFSFHPRKIITTGEGGAIVTNNQMLADRIKLLRSHGGVKKELYLEFFDAGYNFRLSDINAAVGTEQMKRLDEILEKRHKLAGYYQEFLQEMIEIKTPTAEDGYQHSYQSYVIKLANNIDRDAVIRKMRKHEIETTLGTYSISSQKYFSEYGRIGIQGTKNSDEAFRQTLTLPLYPSMRRKDVMTVATILEKTLKLREVQV